MKLLGCLAARKISEAFSIPTVSSVGEWKISSGLCSLRDALGELLLRDVRQEFAADAERPAGERDLDLAVLADGVELVLEQVRDVAGIAGRGDRHHRPRLRDRIGGRQHRGAAEAVPDQQRRRLPRLAQVVGGGNEIVDVRRERGVGEFAFARADAGEVEAQDRDAERRQRIGDALRRHHVLAAGEAVREQRIGARRAGRQVEHGGELLALRVGKIEALGGHGKAPCVGKRRELSAGAHSQRINSRT